MSPASDSSISSFRRANETRAAFTTERSVAIASSSRTKPWSRTRTVFSGRTSGETVMSTRLTGAYVGTSGFSYPTWRGGFYPADAKPPEFLRHYGERLPTLELNASFYHLPSEEQFERWGAEVPKGFRFAVTMSRRVTGRGRVEGLDAFETSVRALGGKLGPIRVKVPQARDDGFLLLLLGSLDPGLRYALDFRHDSWDDPTVTERLDEQGVARVNALGGAAGFRYLRFRDPPYSDQELAGLAAQIRPLLDQGLDLYGYFRHEDEPTAPAYAERLLGLLRGE
jgi:uncharacterized protein YecE (DUF72 family)